MTLATFAQSVRERLFVSKLLPFNYMTVQISGRVFAVFPGGNKDIFASVSIKPVYVTFTSPWHFRQDKLNQNIFFQD